ncbi:MAG: 1-acyl-sn-glycerol-3-phosphate acyltransferase [Armatimonadetes bacterium]|nr:1-acyl-sn-glycerol-3-phosphate acyltransferase [Armatimonadota bacterium]
MSEAGSPLYRLSRVFLRVLFRLYNRWEVTGREHVPASGGVLLIANHTSYADPPIVGAACLRPVNFMAKAELFRIPVLAGFIRRTHAFPVRRGSADRAALRQAIRILRAGNVLLVFPEGKRSSDGRLTDLETGAAFIALSGQAQVVPMALVGADGVLPRGRPILMPAKLRVRFGPPLDLSDFRGQRPTRPVLQQVTDRMDVAFRDLLPPERL